MTFSAFPAPRLSSRMLPNSRVIREPTTADVTALRSDYRDLQRRGYPEPAPDTEWADIAEPWRKFYWRHSNTLAWMAEEEQQ